MQTLLEDLRYAGRALRARPGFTVTAVVTLALGIGGSTAIFSLAGAVLLGKLPFDDPERLVMVWDDSSAFGFPRNDVRPGQFAALRAQNQSFEEMAAVAVTGFTLTGGADPQKVQGQRVTAGFFPMLGVAPALGRVFRADEDAPGAGRVTVLSHGLWQRRFGGDPDVVGRDIQLDGEKYTMIGVMPPTFQFMESYVRLWVPAAFTAEEVEHGSHYLRVIARLKPGVTVPSAQAEVETLSGRFVGPLADRKFRCYVLPLREELVGDTRRPLIVLVLAIASVLLIACANIAGLLLARAATRGREIAVRTALGATRGRIVRQLLTESVLLAALGAVPGLLVASWALSSLQQLVPPTVALSVRPTLDARALAVTLVLAAVTGLLAGLAPALHAARSDLNESLRQGGRGSTGSGHRRLQSALVVAELAATLVLLVGAGLLGQTLYRLRYADLGMRPDGLLTLRTSLASNRYGEPARRAAFYEGVLERLEAMPGIVLAGYTTSVPLEWKGGTNWFLPEGPVQPGRPSANHRQVSTDYLKTMGIPLHRGRFFERTDGPRSQPVAIVNETMARQFWRGEDALGKRFKIGEVGGPEMHPWITIVGIVGDVRQMALDAPVKAEMYLPYSQISDQPWFAPRDLVVRTVAEPMSLVPAVKDAIRGVDPEQPVSNIRSFDEILDEEVVQRRLGASLVMAFAALALLLAAIGVYGVLSHFVNQQTAEIGVRMALGASRHDVLRLVLRKGLALALCGVAFGALGSLALARLVSGMLYGVAAADPTTFVAAASLLVSLALPACYLPARRAAAVDPMIAMRCE